MSRNPEDLAWFTFMAEVGSSRLPVCFSICTAVRLIFLCLSWFILEDRDAHVRHLVKELNVIVIAVDYRKAPEHPFPAALNDCVSATKYVYENCETLGIDRSRISVCGDSAGGNLAAAVALKLRDEGLRFLKNQVLIYPSVQFVNFRLNSFMTDHPLLSRADGVWCALMYAGENLNLLEAVMENEHVNEEFFNNPGFQVP